MSRRAAAALPLGGLLTLALLAGCPGQESGPLPQPPADQYPRVVAAFFTGTLALDVGDNERAIRLLQEASRLAPREPASWANLALIYARSGDAQSARKALDAARRHAPADARIELIAALAAEKAGDAEAAVKYVRRAVEIDPKNLKARYALVKALERSGAEAQAQIVEQLDAILEADPQNLSAALEVTRQKAAMADEQGFRAAVERLRSLSASWPPDIQARLREVSVAGGPGLRAAATRVILIANLLRRSPQFRVSHVRLQNPDNTAVEPFRVFARLPNPKSTPSEPDAGLAYDAASAFPGEPGGLSGAALAGAAHLALGQRPSPEQLPAPDPPPALYAVSGSQVAVAAADGRGSVKRLPFPGKPASRAAVTTLDFAVEQLGQIVAHRPDLALAGSGGLRLLQQTQPYVWRDVTSTTTLPAAVLHAPASGAWPVDVDLDGDLDLLLGRPSGPPASLRNNADGTWSVIPPPPGLIAVADVEWADLDRDADPDLAVLSADRQVKLLLNERGGRYVVGAALDGAPFRAISAADTDGDGRLELVTLSADGWLRAHTFTADPEEPAGSWESRDLAQWTSMPGDGAARLICEDLDNNGAVDLAASAGDATRVWLGDTSYAFQPGPEVELALDDISDLDGDGRLDLVGRDAGGTPRRLRARGTRSYHWQVIRLRAQRVLDGDSRINSFGVGGEIDLRAGLLAQKRLIRGPRVHFGLGENTQTHLARVTWPNGVPQGEFELPRDSAILAEQRLTSSCPFLSAWNGRRIEFVTDILWKSPLGLAINAQGPAGSSQTTDWVRVRGDQLAPVDGEYDLRITADLWETHFFDTVALMVVDHEPDVEIFVDERFSLPQPPPAVIPVRGRMPVHLAYDERGRDVSDLVRSLDRRYLDTFPLGRYQGVAKDHWVEIEIPARFDLSRPAKLIAEGWIYPTNSSLNIAIAQGRHPRPEGLSIEIPDGRGGWKRVRSGLGFPAGKTKSIVLDLEGVVGPSRRLRLRTNMEIYWDAISIAHAAPDARLEQRIIAPRRAELRYRGFSRLEKPNRRSPELPDYARLDAFVPRWSDLSGFHTRFGDVMELLRAVDDRYVIMNAGDEIALRFPAPPTPPGLARDHVFISDGWEKDGDLNTWFGKTVLPLPSHDWPAYDRMRGNLEQDPVYRRHRGDWEQFHTRYVTPDDHKLALWRR